MTGASIPDTKRRTNLKAMGRDDLASFVQEAGQPRYRADQLFNWIYGKGARTFEEMTSLPKQFRARLAEIAELPPLELHRQAYSSDGTVKALFELPSGNRVESVLIPDLDPRGEPKRLTVCVSSQVGCALACSFCATGQMGFRENLTAGDIYDQVWHMNELAQETYGRGISNIVYMGMGEPLMNYHPVLQSIALLTDEDALGLSPKRITVSTVGLAKRIKTLADDDPGVRLAVSLHAPTDNKRSSIMPVNRKEKTDLAALKEGLEYYHEKTGRQITFEYCMFRGFNDTEADAENLARVSRWIPSKVNLIMYNPVDGLGFERTREEQLDRFIQRLVQQGVTVTVRRSRGQDIDAACGQLANKSA